MALSQKEIYKMLLFRDYGVDVSVYEKLADFIIAEINEKVERCAKIADAEAWAVSKESMVAQKTAEKIASDIRAEAL